MCAVETFVGLSSTWAAWVPNRRRNGLSLSSLPRRRYDLRRRRRLLLFEQMQKTQPSPPQHLPSRAPQQLQQPHRLTTTKTSGGTDLHHCQFDHQRPRHQAILGLPLQAIPRAVATAAIGKREGLLRIAVTGTAVYILACKIPLPLTLRRGFSF